MVVTGTIAPSRDIPDLTAEETIRIILSNMNLVVPVICAVVVIIIAIVVICILRSKGNHHKGTFPHITNFSRFLSFFLFPFLFCLFLVPSFSLISMSIYVNYVFCVHLILNGKKKTTTFYPHLPIANQIDCPRTLCPLQYLNTVSANVLRII